VFIVLFRCFESIARQIIDSPREFGYNLAMKLFGKPDPPTPEPTPLIPLAQLIPVWERLHQSRHYPQSYGEGEDEAATAEELLYLLLTKRLIAEGLSVRISLTAPAD